MPNVKTPAEVWYCGWRASGAVEELSEHPSDVKEDFLVQTPRSTVLPSFFSSKAELPHNHEDSFAEMIRELQGGRGKGGEGDQRTQPQREGHGRQGPPALTSMSTAKIAKVDLGDQ